MEKFSIDSSIVVKWFSEEEDTDIALKIRDAYVRGEVLLIVTPLLYCEVVNALRYKPNFDVEKLKRAIDALVNLHLEIEEISPGILRRSAEIAFDCDVTIYDAIPVAVAEKRRGLCITADEKTQYKKMKDRLPIRLLKDYKEF